MSPRCRSCDEFESGEGAWGWVHDRRLWEVSDEIDRLLMLRAHHPFDCGVRADLYPVEWIERVTKE